MRRFLLISGSVAHPSHTRAAADALCASLLRNGAQASIWDLKLRPLPIADPSYHRAVDDHPNSIVREFAGEVRQSDGFALCSPLYHGAYSGVLKNALDQLWYDAFRNKPVALLSHGSTERRCTQPCEQLQTIVKTMYGYSLQIQVATTANDYRQAAEPGFVLQSEEILGLIERQSMELIQLTTLLNSTNVVKES